MRSRSTRLTRRISKAFLTKYIRVWIRREESLTWSLVQTATEMMTGKLSKRQRILSSIVTANTWCALAVRSWTLSRWRIQRRRSRSGQLMQTISEPSWMFSLYPKKVRTRPTGVRLLAVSLAKIVWYSSISRKTKEALTKRDLWLTSTTMSQIYPSKSLRTLRKLCSSTSLRTTCWPRVKTTCITKPAFLGCRTSKSGRFTATTRSSCSCAARSTTEPWPSWARQTINSGFK